MANKNYGFNLCRAVNLSLVQMVKQKYPEIDSHLFVCRSYNRIKRSPGSIVEHFSGAILTKQGWLWFDGTGDQLDIENPTEIIYDIVTDENSIIQSLHERLGGKWQKEYVSPSER